MDADAEAYAAGYHQCVASGAGPLIIGITTNNSLNVSRELGVEWASDVVNPAETWAAREWVAGYVSASGGNVFRLATPGDGADSSAPWCASGQLTVRFDGHAQYDGRPVTYYPFVVTNTSGQTCKAAGAQAVTASTHTGTELDLTAGQDSADQQVTVLPPATGAAPRAATRVPRHHLMCRRGTGRAGSAAVALVQCPQGLGERALQPGEVAGFAMMVRRELIGPADRGVPHIVPGTLDERTDIADAVWIGHRPVAAAARDVDR